MNKIIGLLIIMVMSGCVSDYSRIEDCIKKYPNAKVTPSTSLIKRQGFEITVEDTITHQIYAVSYMPFSTTKIWTIMNIR